MNADLSNVLKHIETYFKNNLPNYAVLEVRRKSYHPDDKHLFMVSAKKVDDGTYAVWSTWNEELQTLNHGHYGLKSTKACDEIFAGFQDNRQYFAVYKCSQNARLRLFIADSEKDAEDFCQQHHWELTDENNFVWDLDYREITGPDTSCREEH